MEAATENNKPAVNKDESPPIGTPEGSVEKSPPPQPQEANHKKSKKEDRHKKEDKTVEHFMKSLNSTPTIDEKFSLLSKKYAQTAEETKKLQFYVKQSDKRYAILTKEKDQLQHEFNKTVLVKSKLENLCRELQKQNKSIKEESLLKIREEEERRKETQSKFQTTLSEITTMLQQNNEKNTKLRDDNINMSEKFKTILQQYQLREQQVEKMSKQMALESQLNDAKLQKASLEHQAEKGRLLADMEQVKMELHQSKAKIQEMESVEAALRAQLDIYTEKYDEFQGALVKSNQVFTGFKGEMEKMSKKIQSLEKECMSWKSRWEVSQRSLIEMCAERQASQAAAASQQNQYTHLHQLCRHLQAERTALINTLKENNIPRPPVPAMPPPATPPAAENNTKVDAMAANCAQLKQSLASLQSQLNTLTNKQTPPKEDPPKAEKSKKKHRKNKDKKSNEKDIKINENKDQNSVDAVPETTDKAQDEASDVQPNVQNDKAQNSVKTEESVKKPEENASNEKVSNSQDDKAQHSVKTNEESKDKPKQNVSNEKVPNSKEIKAENLLDKKSSTEESSLSEEKSMENIIKTMDEVNISNPTKIEVNNDTSPIKSSTEIDLKVVEDIDVISIQEDVERSFCDPTSNDEIAHIDEIKPILNGAHISS